MPIYETITEQAKLKKCWKSRLIALGLAGFGLPCYGQYASAQTQNYQPTAETQQRAQQDQLLRSEFLPTSVTNGMGYMLGKLNVYNKAGLLSPEDVTLYNKMIQIFTLNADGNKSWQSLGPSWKKGMITDAWSDGQLKARNDVNTLINIPKMSKAFIVQNAAAMIRGAERKIGQGYDDYIKTYYPTAANKEEAQAIAKDTRARAIDQNTLKELNLYATEQLSNKLTQEQVNNSGENVLIDWQNTLDHFTEEMTKIKDPSIQKQYKTILDKLQANINLYKSYLISPNYVKNKDTVERILDFKQENKDFFPVSSKTVEKYGKNGLDFLEKNYQKFVDDEGDVNVADGSNQQKYERLISQFKSDVSSYKSYLAKIDASSQSSKSDFKQDQSPAASQSPQLPLPKSLDTSIQGFDAKTTGIGTGITKNGDIFTGEWKDGFANGLGERTLINKGYTGSLVKTGNKIDTQWKNGMPVDGAKVKVTRPDGTVFNGHIKSSSDTSWGYVIVK
jgi:hypothetical protein